MVESSTAAVVRAARSKWSIRQQGNKAMTAGRGGLVIRRVTDGREVDVVEGDDDVALPWLCHGDVVYVGVRRGLGGAAQQPPPPPPSRPGATRLADSAPPPLLPPAGQHIVPPS